MRILETIKDTFGLSETANVDAATALPNTVYITYSSPQIAKLLKAIKQMWKKNLNIDVAIKPSEWQGYYPEVQKVGYQIAQMGWGAYYPYPTSFLDNFVTASPNNLAKQNGLMLNMTTLLHKPTR